MLPYLSEPLFNKCLKTILDNEKIPVSLDILSYARYIANNNIGKALDLLQLTYLQEKTIGVAEISKIGKQMMNKSIESLFWKTLDGNFKLIRKGLRDIFTNENLSKNEILLELDRYIFRIPLDRITRAKLVELIAQTDFDSLDSIDDEIQIESLLIRIASIGTEIKIEEKR
jgi:DNA polymerase III delta prime subunit